MQQNRRLFGKSVSIGLSVKVILMQQITIIMKPIFIKKTVQILLVSSMIFCSIVITKNFIKNIKSAYAQKNNHKGTTCFFDMMQ